MSVLLCKFDVRDGTFVVVVSSKILHGGGPLPAAWHPVLHCGPQSLLNTHKASRYTVMSHRMHSRQRSYHDC